MSEGISMPSGIGGLMRFNQEYRSKFRISPTAVIIFIVAVLLFVVALNMLFPVTA